MISTLTSPEPWRSLFGQEQMGDGLLYWLLIAIFTLSNNLMRITLFGGLEPPTSY
ncbi:hypothetical protein [Nostoc sp.]|uniref:hypothetical protein n=1 Tax=Nostoc sp. TaxID=1180 RepID=UPI002FF7609E